MGGMDPLCMCTKFETDTLLQMSVTDLCLALEGVSGP